MAVGSGKQVCKGATKQVVTGSLQGWCYNCLLITWWSGQ